MKMWRLILVVLLVIAVATTAVAFLSSEKLRKVKQP